MNWIIATRRNLELLEDGTVAWVFSKDTRKCSAAVYRTATGWHCHGQEHFTVPSVTRYIVLPLK